MEILNHNIMNKYLLPIIILLFVWKNDKLNGEFVRYYENGKLKSEATYAEDLLNGTEKIYHKNGKLKSEYEYINDEQVGDGKQYNEDGKLFVTKNQ